jgi:RNA polymerase sigma-70 factor (ECF subfamily)
MSADSDRLLIQQIRRGDQNAWDALIERYEGRLLAFVERRLHDRSAAEDIVQETFVGFVSSLPNFDETRDLQTYLFTIAAHKLTDHLRRIGRHPLQHLPDGQEFFEQQMDRRAGVSSMARSRERMQLESEAVTRVLGSLVADWKAQGEFQRLKVIELLFVKGWANKDVAAFLGIKEQQVANIRFAAVRKLADYMREAGLPAEVFPELRGGRTDG